jgi:hypothetical protein
MHHSSQQQRGDEEYDDGDDEVLPSPLAQWNRSSDDDCPAFNEADQPGQPSSDGEKDGSIDDDEEPPVKKTPLAKGMRPLPSEDGIPTIEILAILQKPPEDVLPRIPRGNKDNAFCVVDNRRNVNRNARNQKSVYDDDCGAWCSSAGHTTQIPYLLQDDGSLKRTYVNAQTGKASICWRRSIGITLTPWDTLTAHIILGVAFEFFYVSWRMCHELVKTHENGS